MSRKALIAYATRFGSTIEIAGAVGAVQCKADVCVDVRLSQDVTGLDEYEAAILGSSARDGKWLPEATNFLKLHQQALAVRRLALFVVCIALAQDTPENRKTALMPGACAERFTRPEAGGHWLVRGRDQYSLHGLVLTAGRAQAPGAGGRFSGLGDDS